MDKRKTKEEDYQKCDNCTGNIDLKLSDYLEFKYFEKGKIKNHRFFHKICWEKKYKEEVEKSAKEYVNFHLKGQMDLLKKMMNPSLAG